MILYDGFCYKFLIFQAQLSLSRGGLGLRSLSCHSVAAYLASLSSSGFDKSFNLHLSESIVLFNALVPAADSITEELLATSNLRQHALSSKIEDQQFRQLFDLSSPAHRARLLSVSSCHAVPIVLTTGWTRLVTMH